jgi:hypothetical protein
VASKYDAAVAALHQAPFEAFVAERKRLAEDETAASVGQATDIDAGNGPPEAAGTR